MVCFNILSYAAFQSTRAAPNCTDIVATTSTTAASCLKWLPTEGETGNASRQNKLSRRCSYGRNPQSCLVSARPLTECENQNSVANQSWISLLKCVFWKRSQPPVCRGVDGRSRGCLKTECVLRWQSQGWLTGTTYRLSLRSSTWISLKAGELVGWTKFCSQWEKALSLNPHQQTYFNVKLSAYIWSCELAWMRPSEIQETTLSVSLLYLASLDNIAPWISVFTVIFLVLQPSCRHGLLWARLFFYLRVF